MINMTEKQSFEDLLEQEDKARTQEIIEGFATNITTDIEEIIAKSNAESAKAELATPEPEVQISAIVPQPIPAPAKAVVQDDSGYSIYFDTNRFEQAQRAATMLSKSTIVPEHYRGNVSNCLIALDMSANLGLNPLLFMQKSAIINGKMAFEGQLVISLVNKMKPFNTPISFDYEGKDKDLVCTAWAISKAGQRVEYKLRYADAIKIGNAGKNSNWQNATQLMISYRAATYLVRLYAPEILLGCYTTEEAHDMKEDTRGDAVAAALTKEVLSS